MIYQSGARRRRRRRREEVAARKQSHNKSLSVSIKVALLIILPLFQTHPIFSRNNEAPSSFLPAVALSLSL